MRVNLIVLYRLQQMDRQIEEVTQALESSSTSNGKTELQDVEKRFETVQARKRDEERILKDAELELATLENEKKTVQTKLFSGKITNPKELSQLEKELEQIDKRREKLDDRVLRQMEKLEHTGIEAKTQQTVLDKTRVSFEEDRNVKETHRAQLEKQLNDTQTRRDALAQTVEESLLELYNALKKRKGGLAVVKVQKNSCGGCFMQVPEGSLQKVKALELEYCSSCGRILYLDKEM